jgi:hypothetical protein
MSFLAVHIPGHSDWVRLGHTAMQQRESVCQPGLVIPGDKWDRIVSELPHTVLGRISFLWAVVPSIS